jgi:DNA-binding MarR family transcriptional regulator
MVETRWLDEGEARAWRAHIDGVHLLLKVLDRQLQRDAGLSFADYELLVALSEAPDRRLRMRDLADVTFGTRSGVTRAISRLEAQGWVRRRECADDGRGTEAQLTPAGQRKLAASAVGHVEAVRRHVFDVLTPAQVRTWGTASVALRAGLLDNADEG